MKPVRRISVSLPAALIDEALEISGKSLPPTLAEGLRLLKRKSLFDKAMQLKGKPVSVIVADTSTWIEHFAGRVTELFDEALQRSAIVLPPIVARPGR